MSKYLSRKFLMAFFGGVVIMVNAILEANGMASVDPEVVLAFVGLLASYIFGEAYVDGKAAAADQRMVQEYKQLPPVQGYSGPAQPDEEE